MIIRGFLLVLVACFCFTPDCTGQVTPSLNGIWLLTGGWDPFLGNGPRLTLTMGADGEGLFAEGDYQIPGCGSTFAMRGKLAADGTFTLSSTTISITGTFADGGSSKWSGSYKASFPHNCGSSSGDFIANRIESPHGTYSGELKTTDGKTVIVSLQLIAGEFTSIAPPENVDVHTAIPWNVLHFTPVTGTLNVVGLGDMDNTELTPADGPYSRMYGDEFVMTFPLGSKSRLIVGGSLRDGEAKAMSVALGVDNEGKRSETAMGVLTRQ